MKKLSALLLSLLLLLTACGTPATPGDAVTLPTPNDEILVEEGLHAEDLPEVCRLWFVNNYLLQKEQQASACLPCRRGRVQLPRRPPAGRNVHRSHSGGQACR